MKTLLRVPDLAVALSSLVGREIGSSDIFQLIGEGEIEPLGVLQRAPVFGLEQIGEIAETLQKLFCLTKTNESEREKIAIQSEQKE